MYSSIKNVHGNTSTPKRRRLGTGRILRPNLNIFDKDTSPKLRCSSPLNRNDDPPIPCNQIEYLSDSGNNSSVTSEIPCSPAGILDNSIMRNSNWESLVVSKHQITNNEVSNTMCKEFNEIEDISENISNQSHFSKEASTSLCKVLNEIEDISDDMFYSKLEIESSLHRNLLTSRYEKQFCRSIEDSFNAINQSLRQDELNKIDNSALFETRDSFLLDIKESSIIYKEFKNVPNKITDKPKSVKEREVERKDSFYGLPMITKDLFKSYRNIEKFYGE